MRRSLIAVLVTALVATAGCTGAIDPGASGGGDGGAPADADFGPPAINQSTFENHASTIREAGSFTIDATLNSPDSGTDLHGRVSYEASRAVLTTDAGGRTRTVYATESKRFTKVSGNGDTQYQTREMQTQFDQLLLGSLVPTSATFERTGYDTVDGETVAVYEAVSLPDDFSNVPSDADGSATLSLTESGVIKRVEWSATGPDGAEFSAEITVSDVGSTTVEEPDWVEKAASGSEDRPRSNAPAVAFEIERVDGGVEITHNGGDEVSAGQLVVLAGDRQVEWKGSGSVQAGDSMVVEDVPQGTTIRVVWQSESGDSAVLDQGEA